MNQRTEDDRRTEKRRLREPYQSSALSGPMLFWLSVVALETLYIISTLMP